MVCFYCGGLGKVRIDTCNIDHKYQVYCPHCYARGPSKPTREEAVKFWEWVERLRKAAYDSLDVLKDIL